MSFLKNQFLCLGLIPLLLLWYLFKLYTVLVQEKSYKEVCSKDSTQEVTLLLGSMSLYNLQQEKSHVMPAKWLMEGIKYLGVKLSRSNAKIIEANIDPLIFYIEELWSKNKLLFFGRISAIKMVILLELFFCFPMHLLTLQLKYWIEYGLQSIHLSGIIKSLREKKFQMEVFAAPNIAKYYKCHCVVCNNILAASNT